MITRLVIFLVIAISFVSSAGAQGFFKKPPAATPAEHRPTASVIPAPLPSTNTARTDSPTPMPSPLPALASKSSTARPPPSPAVEKRSIKLSGKKRNAKTAAPKSGAALMPEPTANTVPTTGSKPAVVHESQSTRGTESVQRVPGPDEVCSKFNMIGKALCVAKECLVRPGHPQCMKMAKEAEERRAFEQNNR